MPKPFDPFAPHVAFTEPDPDLNLTATDSGEVEPPPPAVEETAPTVEPEVAVPAPQAAPVASKPRRGRQGRRRAKPSLEEALAALEASK